MGGISAKSVQPPSGKESTLKGKNLLLRGANSFLLEWTPFEKRISVQDSKQEITKVVSHVKNGRKNIPSVSMII